MNNKYNANNFNYSSNSIQLSKVLKSLKPKLYENEQSLLESIRNFHKSTDFMTEVERETFSHIGEPAVAAFS